MCVEQPHTAEAHIVTTKNVDVLHMLFHLAHLILGVRLTGEPTQRRSRATLPTASSNA